MFQPRAGTALRLFSVANVTSYLSLSQCLIYFLDLSMLPSVYLIPSVHHPYTELHHSLHPIIPPLLLLYCLSTWKSVHSHWPPLPVPAVAALLPLTYYPGPCRPLHPRAASPFLPPLLSSVRPPLSALDVTNVPFNPCGFSLLRFYKLISSE